MKFQLMLLPLLAHLSAMPAWAQPLPAPLPAPQLGVAESQNGQSPPVEAPLNTIQDYALGPGDVVEITVMGIPGLDRQEFTLDGQGRISLPYVNLIRLNGMTAHDAQVKIAALYEVSLLQDPQVSLRVKEYKSQFCYVLGAVQKPGKYQLTQETFLLDALTLAGGLTDKADIRAKIRHSSPTDATAQTDASSGASEAQEINLSELFYNGGPRRNLVIRSGDVITIPERKEGLYFVVGDIQKPGAFLIPNNEKMTLSRALANAGGPLKTAAGNKTMIIRQKPGSELPDQIKVNAMAVMKGEARDVELQENDIVLVPGSASKTLGKNFFTGLNSYLASLLIFGIK